MTIANQFYQRATS